MPQDLRASFARQQLTGWGEGWAGIEGAPTVAQQSDVRQDGVTMIVRLRCPEAQKLSRVKQPFQVGFDVRYAVKIAAGSPTKGTYQSVGVRSEEQDEEGDNDWHDWRIDVPVPQTLSRKYYVVARARYIFSDGQADEWTAWSEKSSLVAFD